MSIQKKSKTDLRKQVLIRNFEKLNEKGRIQEINEIINRTIKVVLDNSYSPSYSPELFFLTNLQEATHCPYYIE